MRGKIFSKKSLNMKDKNKTDLSFTKNLQSIHFAFYRYLQKNHPDY
ncbi:hypothetical protein ApDm4_2543 [Acetobacter pomorum]|nr:hypothetical protein ApDm4_2543 [Acetobacter pomorum]